MDATKKLVFGDPDSIAARDKAIEDGEKKEAKTATVQTYYQWMCPNCREMEWEFPEEEWPWDNYYKCPSCKKWTKLEKS